MQDEKGPGGGRGQVGILEPVLKEGEPYCMWGQLVKTQPIHHLWSQVGDADPDLQVCPQNPSPSELVREVSSRAVLGEDSRNIRLGFS